MTILTPAYKSIKQTIKINGRRIVLPTTFADMIDERNGYRYPIHLFFSLQCSVSQTRSFHFIALYDSQTDHSDFNKIQINKRRIILPEEAIKHASLEDEIAIIGVNDHIELWNPKTHQAYENLQAIK